MDAWEACLKRIQKKWNKDVWSQKFKALSRAWNRQARKEDEVSKDQVGCGVSMWRW